MRSGFLLLLTACGNGVYYYPAADIAEADSADAFRSPDMAETDFATEDLSVEDLATLDMHIAEDMAMQPPDLLGIDFAPCGQPNGECCTFGTACDQTAAMNSGFVGSICSSGTCAPCGVPAQPCCALDKCVRSAQLNAYCYTNPDSTKLCLECGGSNPPCPPQ